jgi:uncharacterized GH25 family protein
MIEALVRWTEMKFKESDKAEDYLKQVIDGEDPIPQAEITTEFSPMVFDMEDVVRFNRANTENLTTVRFDDGDVFVVSVPYKKFCELYIQATGKSIVSVIDKKDKPAPKTDLDDLSGF